MDNNELTAAASAATINAFLDAIIPKLELEILADRPEAERRAILSGVERGVREAFAHGCRVKAASDNYEITPADIDKAAVRLADAFAIIEEYRGLMPSKTYNYLADAVSDWIHSSDLNWIADPKMIRAAMPPMLRKLIEAELDPPNGGFRPHEALKDFIERIDAITGLPIGQLLLDVIAEAIKRPHLIEETKNYIDHPAIIKDSERALRLLLNRLREGSVPRIEELAA